LKRKKKILPVKFGKKKFYRKNTGIFPAQGGMESTITHTPCAKVPKITGIHLVIPFTGIGS